MSVNPTAAEGPSLTRPRSTWSWWSLCLPLLGIAALFGVSFWMGDGRSAILTLVYCWIGLLITGIVVVIAVFRRRERARWVSVVSLLLLLFMMFGGVSSSGQAGAVGGPPLPKKGETVEQRLQALEEYIAEGTPPDPPAVTGPTLTQRGMDEFAKRMPGAVEKETKLRFDSEGHAVLTISYAKADGKRIEQEVHFLFSKKTWHMFWMKDGKGIPVSSISEPTTRLGDVRFVVTYRRIESTPHAPLLLRPESVRSRSSV